MNISCVICSDLIVSADSIFSTPCGHIFHHVCLMQWMERSKSCPQCRNKCSERNIFRIYFNNTGNLDSSENAAANLIESNDNLTLQVREKDQALKEVRLQKEKLENAVKLKDKKIDKLDVQVSQNVQIIATMRHEMDIMKSHRSSYKTIETENNELKSKLDLMSTIESVLTASQSEVDEILKQNLNAKDLAVMVGTLRRELNSNELRKNEIRKQMQLIKNDLRAEQEVRRKLQDKLSYYESENHRLKTHLRRYEKDEAADKSTDTVNSSIINTPELAKRPRLAQKLLNELNTPSPLTQEEFKSRVDHVKSSDSPYLKVKSSSIALSSVLKKPIQMRHAHQGFGVLGPKPTDGVNKLSIFNKPRVAPLRSISSSKPENSNVTYNGIGGTTTILQSDLIQTNSFENLWPSTSKATNVIKRKKLSPSALGK